MYKVLQYAPRGRLEVTASSAADAVGRGEKWESGGPVFVETPSGAIVALDRFRDGVMRGESFA
jgi:hypothetical protein